jgi:hypothetical protein
MTRQPWSRRERPPARTLVFATALAELAALATCAAEPGRTLVRRTAAPGADADAGADVRRSPQVARATGTTGAGGANGAASATDAAGAAPLLAGCGPADPPAPPDERRRVVIVSIDGLRPDVLSRRATPNLWALACRGVHATAAETIYPSLTLPSHASMLSGYPPERHGIDWNDARDGFIAVPTLFTAAKARGLRTVLVTGKEKMAQLAAPEDRDVYTYVADTDSAVAATAVAEMRAGYDLLFVHFPNVDLTGHGFGWLSDEYLEAVRTADEAFGEVFAARAPETVFIVTADHGGSDFGHGADEPEHMRIPWLAAGPGLRARHAVTRGIVTYDTAATAAALLGLTLPADTRGRAVTEILAP